MKRMKKIISASLAAGMLAAAAVPTGATYFSDIAIGHWGRDGVNYATDNGYIGYSGTKFNPYNSITRAEVALILYKLALSPSVTVTSSFTDVPASSPYAKAISWAKSEGIINGTTPTTFKPNDPVIRQDFALMLYRYSVKKGYNTSKTTSLSMYNDSSTVSNYALTAVKWAVASKVMEGDTDVMTIFPKENVTRISAAEMSRRFGLYVEGVVFRRDNFNFINSSDYFDSTYYISDEHYSILKYLLKMYGNYSTTVEAKLQSERSKAWEGSCYGMSLAVALSKLGKLDLVGNFGESVATKVNDLNSTNKNLRSAINFYQVSQSVAPFSSWRKKICGYKSSNTLSNVFNEIPEKIDNVGVIPFSYFYYDSVRKKNVGHTILLYDYSVDSYGKYTVYAYNPNSAIKDEFSFYKNSSSYKVDKQDVLEAWLPYNENADLSDTYYIYDKYDLDSYYNDFDRGNSASSSIPASSETASMDNTYLTVRLKGEFVIENAEGEKLIFKDGEFSGDMEIISDSPIITGSDEAIQSMIEVRNSDSFTLTTDNGEAELSVLNSKIFSEGSGRGVSEIMIDNTGKVSVDGQNMNYEITTFVSGEGIEMFTVSGNADRCVSVENCHDGWTVDGAVDAFELTTYNDFSQNGAPIKNKSIINVLADRRISIQSSVSNLASMEYDKLNNCEVKEKE